MVCLWNTRRSGYARRVHRAYQRAPGLPGPAGRRRVGDSTKVSENQREILRTMTQDAEAMGMYDQPEIAADDSEPKLTKEEFEQRYAQQSGVTIEELPVQELRTALRRAEMERDECSEGVLDMGAELVSLRADLNRANEHNRALTDEVNQQSAVIAELNEAVRWQSAKIEQWKAQRKHLQDLVDQQASDVGLWFVAKTVAEAYVQQELRKLHASIDKAQQS